MQDALKELEILLDPYDWFYEVEAEPRRYVVYVTTMCQEQDNIIPDRASDGRQVVVHFSGSKTATAQSYFVDDKPSLLKSVDAIATVGSLPLPLSNGVKPYSPFDRTKFEVVSEKDMEFLRQDAESDDVDVPNLGTLASALTRLEKQCGANILFDIFFEIHDGKNAVTNLGARYPEVKEAMKELYDEYGFDPIYEELEG